MNSTLIPATDELTRLTHTIAHQVARYRVRQGLLESATGNVYLIPEAMDATDKVWPNQLFTIEAGYIFHNLDVSTIQEKESTIEIYLIIL
jgi:hypothetical protein